MLTAIAKNGYDKFFDVALQGCNILLNKEITNVDMEKNGNTLRK